MVSVSQDGISVFHGINRESFDGLSGNIGLCRSLTNRELLSSTYLPHMKPAHRDIEAVGADSGLTAQGFAFGHHALGLLSTSSSVQMRLSCSRRRGMALIT